MNTLTALEILASADSIESAVSQLTAEGFTPNFRTSQFSDGWYELPELNFFMSRGRLCVNLLTSPGIMLATTALQFHAQQQDLATQVPASASPVVEQPQTEQSTDFVDKSQAEKDFDNGIFHPCSTCGASFDPYRLKNCTCADGIAA